MYLHVRGVIVDLRDVSPRIETRHIIKRPGIGRLDRSRDELKRVGEAILAEQLPRLAIKYAPAVRGSRAVAARMMGLALVV